MNLDPTMQRYDSVKTRRLYEQILDQFRTIPGVRSVALSRTIPLGYNNISIDVFFEGDVQGAEGNRTEVFFTSVTPDYFDVMRLPLVAGRAFTGFDTDSTPPVAVVSAAMAQRFWPGQNAIGKRFRITQTGPLVEIVGIAKDVKHIFLSESPRPFAYFPVAQLQPRDVIVHVATTGDPAPMIAPVRSALRRIDPALGVFDLKTMDFHIHGGVALLPIRLAAVLASAVGLLGLVQTIVGLYGVISYAVSQRTREIGIRLALGARGADVVRGVVRQGLVLTAIGTAMGLAIALGVTRAMATLLVGVKATDLLTFSGAAVILGGLALLSTYLPARRAARLEPVSALRAD
jgi:putative ABC transport system permease protein